MCAKSLKGAQHIGEVIADTPQHTESYKEGVLVGGMVSIHINLSQQDIRLIKAIGPLFTSSNIPEVAMSFRSLYIGQLHRNNRKLVNFTKIKSCLQIIYSTF